MSKIIHNRAAKPGKTIINTITGETLTFTQTAAMTSGKLLEFHLTLDPGSTVPMKHIHTAQDEVFEVVSGRVNVEVGTDTHVIEPGERIVMPKGIPHRWWNDPEVTSKLNVSFIPALNTEEFFIEVFALASAGKTKPNGAPTFLQAARMCGKYSIYHPLIPVFIQKGVSSVFNIF
ncbi:MAG TPA: cupin domain-containing protein [Ignavibacteria bacterium]|nr:cupin domain-containing protein [Ignavibacteria bacterium]